MGFVIANSTAKIRLSLTEKRRRGGRLGRMSVASASKMSPMSQMAPSLVELAGRFGISTAYEDWSGRRVDVPECTLISVLAALGVDAADEAKRNLAAPRTRKRTGRVRYPRPSSAQAGAPTTFWVPRDPRPAADVWVQLEDGTVSGRDTTGRQLHPTV